MREKRLFWWILALGVIGFLLLAGKNPFSAGSIIANLQPFPDTLYYATPAWNFVHGAGYAMRFAGFEISIITPPLYSIYLMPFFALFGDVRMFYFANLLLMGGSVVLFFLICRKIFGENLFGQLLSGLLTFFLIANFYVFTLPTLLLAENLTFFLFIYGFYLLVSKENKRTDITVIIVGFLLLFVKFSNIPLTAALYLIQAYKNLKNRKKLMLFSIHVLLSAGVFTAYYLLFQPKEGGVKILATVFSLENLMKHFYFYTFSIFGGENIFLWFRERFISPLLGILALLGLVWGLSTKKRKNLVFQVVFMILATVLFMSFFYVIDTRYVLAILPMLLILVGLALEGVKNKTNQKTSYLVMIAFSALLLFLPGLGQRTGEMTAITLGKKIVGNVRGSETPWYYLSVNEFNKFFEQDEHKGAYLGTFLPPFFVDFYTNDTYRYLPISKDQDFFSFKGGLSEKLDITDIKTHYKVLLTNGERVYVSNAFVTNLSSWVNEFEELKQVFKLTRVHEGCLNSCDIYKVELK